MSYLHNLCLLRIVVSNAYCVVFVYISFLRLLNPMLPVSLDFPFLIDPSVFSNVFVDKANIVINKI